MERRLYNELVINGYSVRTRVKCGTYRIDPVIGRLTIECDGKDYHSSLTQKIQKKKTLGKQGFKVCCSNGNMRLFIHMFFKVNIVKSIGLIHGYV
ncbi:hypothetical protein ACQKGA_23800 [Priestia megaterium]|uniref:hypothetical protein n=1 Tax=Priestia megaterium TaxID=1404 RepID=UPI003D06ED79